MMSADMVYEQVPRLTKRVGDGMLAGSNNATILLGRDRLGRVDSGYGSLSSPTQGKDAGAIHLMVGRVAEDPSLIEDKATIYISAMTDPDDALGDILGSRQSKKSAIIGRADCVRISARTDIKISAGRASITLDSSGTVTIDGDIQLGAGAAQRIMLADPFQAFWSTLMLPGPSGPVGPPPPLPSSCISQGTKAR